MQKGQRRRRFDILSYFRKLGRLLGVFARNPRGFIGLIIIGVFVVIAFVPGAFTPYDPTRDNFLAGFMVAPRWLGLLPSQIGGNPDLSENYYPIVNPGLQYANLTGWNITSDSHVAAGYLESYMNHSGVLHFSFSRDEVGTTYGVNKARFYQTFYYPYLGSPWSFYGQLVFSINGTITQILRNESYMNWSNPNQWPWPTRLFNSTTYDVPMNVSVFVETVSINRSLPVWPLRSFYQTQIPAQMNGMAIDGTYVNATNANTWINTNELVQPIDSWGALITEMIWRFYHTTLPNQIFFPKDSCPGYYRVGVDITFFDNVNASRPVTGDVYIDTLDLGMKGSSWGIMGTDQEGRDLWSQLMYGARISLYVGVLSSVMAIGIGLVIGLMAGYLGRVVDEFLMRICDVLLVLPGLPLLIVLVAVLGTSIDNLIIILGALGWMGFARIVRSQVISLRERPFIEAAKAVGAGKTHIMFRHILPNVMSLVYVSLATTVPGNIVAEASLGFLGFTDPNRMSWGLMLGNVSAFSAYSNWWWVIPPGLCIALIAIAFIMFGYALDEILNPRLRLRR